LSVPESDSGFLKKVSEQEDMSKLEVAGAEPMGLGGRDKLTYYLRVVSPKKKKGGRGHGKTRGDYPFQNSMSLQANCKTALLTQGTSVQSGRETLKRKDIRTATSRIAKAGVYQMAVLEGGGTVYQKRLQRKSGTGKLPEGGPKRRTPKKKKSIERKSPEKQTSVSKATRITGGSTRKAQAEGKESSCPCCHSLGEGNMQGREMGPCLDAKTWDHDRRVEEGKKKKKKKNPPPPPPAIGSSIFREGPTDFRKRCRGGKSAD